MFGESMACLAATTLCVGAVVARADDGLSTTKRSPQNQVFQFKASYTCDAWPDGSSTKSTAYLWIPEACTRVRGLLVLCANVPEHMLVGDASLREVCRANDLAILWSVPTFMNFKKDMAKEHKVIVDNLQRLLDELATTSGYEEVAIVPWLPIGESAHLLMVDALVESKPERCIAGVWLKNNHLPPTNRNVPALVYFGTAQEWTQDKTDIRAKWNDVQQIYESVLGHLHDSPEWPLSYVLDGHTGHFDCSERTTRFVADYIDAAAKARLPDHAGAPLKPVDRSSGVVTALAVPGHLDAKGDKTGAPLPWYFNRTLANEAWSISSINWTAHTQLPAFLDDKGSPRPFEFNGIANIKSVTWEPDGVTFQVRARLLEQIPATFANPGEPLATTPGEPSIEWICGQLAPVSTNRFRIALDRTYGSGPTYLLARKEGSDTVRTSIQPCSVQISALRNSVGKPQVITFNPPASITIGTPSIGLEATSDAGLPVSYFVEAGPAIIENNRLVFQPIPPRSNLPITVTVAAWQWGRSMEPQVKTADVVRREIRLTTASE